MNITILGAHSSESKTTKCISILVDKVLAIDAGALTSSLSLNEQKRIKSILITHAHFDHIKDIPLLSLNFFRMNTRIHIYTLDSVKSIIQNHLLNGKVYPHLQDIPKKKPTVIFHRIVPFQERILGKYRISAIPVNHSTETVGYQIRNSEGKVLFYAADSGSGLSSCWQHVSCQLLIIETSFPNDREEYARDTGHLTPNQLLTELLALKESHRKLPQILIVHNDPLFENEIKRELGNVAKDLKTHISVASEGLQLNL
jgi:ribonuclease BN (tRNA processing enzyme)